jgi:hypothetical protein
MIGTLPEGPLDIVGDVHGELQALQSLLGHLGYAADGRHPQGRRLIFVGDLCDRGPDSPGVVRLVQRLVEAERAFAILGNHELNLLCRERKDGNDWFWDEGSERDRRYEPTAKPTPAEQDEVLAFFGALPLALQRDDLRVVHAAWHEQAIAAVQAHTAAHASAGSSALQAYQRFASESAGTLKDRGLRDEAKREQAAWGHVLPDPAQPVPMLHALAAIDELKQMGNPVKVLTSGVERKGQTPFYSSGKWRFVQRVPWWDEYDHPVPVVVGHYWRRLQPVERMVAGNGDADLFADIAPTAWHGARSNVFCVDFSVGGRYRERIDGQTGATTHLAALRWPERELVLDSGRRLATTPAV